MKRQITIKTQGPTGSGKSYVMAHIINALKERGFVIVKQDMQFATEDALIVEFDPVEITETAPRAFSNARISDDSILEAMANFGTPNDERGTSTYNDVQALAAGKAVLSLAKPAK